MPDKIDYQQRPKRISLPDFSGRLITLQDDPVSWQELANNGEDILLLGLGPGDPADLPFVKIAQDNGRSIFWIEEEKVLNTVNAIVKRTNNWQQLALSDIQNIAKKSKIFFYRQGLRLAPKFWGPLLASLELALNNACSASSSQKSVWLPGNNTQLLHQELTLALSEAGFDQVLTSTFESAKALSQSGTIPDFVLSINFRGFDSEGHIFYLLREMRIPVAIWLVDNPYNLLSALKYPWWQDAHLFLTDPSFTDGLRQLGATRVDFCPLAASQHMWRRCQDDRGSFPIFVGRSAFPDQDAFFKGSRIAPQLLELAQLQFSKDSLPDYHWWLDKLKVKPWPGMASRQAGKGADYCSAYNRERWLAEAVKADLRIIGDAGWKKMFPHTEISPPVDYYGSLPYLYNQASCILNITSLLLPHSLNQRHFDVWAAGGFLLTDDSPGLSIFPQELTRPISLKKPADFEKKLKFYMENPEKKISLIKEWQKYIFENHQYRHRLKFIMEKLEI